MSPEDRPVASPLAVLSRARLLPAISPLNEVVVSDWADACVASGVPALELLLRGEGAEPAAFAAITRLTRSHPSLAVGVGTVFDADTARRAIDAGARIVVSPIIDTATGAVCQAASVDWLPGAFTPTEIELAERTGAQQVSSSQHSPSTPPPSCAPSLLRDPPLASFQRTSRLKRSLPWLRRVRRGSVWVNDSLRVQRVPQRLRIGCARRCVQQAARH